MEALATPARQTRNGAAAAPLETGHYDRVISRYEQLLEQADRRMADMQEALDAARDESRTLQALHARELHVLHENHTQALDSMRSERMEREQRHFQEMSELRTQVMQYQLEAKLGIAQDGKTGSDSVVSTLLTMMAEHGPTILQRLAAPQPGALSHGEYSMQAAAPAQPAQAAYQDPPASRQASAPAAEAQEPYTAFVTQLYGRINGAIQLLASGDEPTADELEAMATELKSQYEAIGAPFSADDWKAVVTHIVSQARAAEIKPDAVARFIEPILQLNAEAMTLVRSLPESMVLKHITLSADEDERAYLKSIITVLKS